MNCMFNENDIDLFYEYLNKCDCYFEYGSGGSTFNSVINNNIKYVYSVESDIDWYNDITNKLLDYNYKFKYFFIDLNSEPNSYGRPGGTKAAGLQGLPSKPDNVKCTNDWKKYSDVFLNLSSCEQKNINLILIDGRFRVACCLKLFEYINNETVVLFDDFKNREWFHIVLNYYEIINDKKNGNMVALKKKNVDKPNQNIIEQYEIDYR